MDQPNPLEGVVRALASLQHAAYSTLAGGKQGVAQHLQEISIRWNALQADVASRMAAVKHTRNRAAMLAVR